MMLSGIQAKLVYQKIKLLLQNVRINHHKFIPADPVGVLRENCHDLLGCSTDKGITCFMPLLIVDLL